MKYWSLNRFFTCLIIGCFAAAIPAVPIMLLTTFMDEGLEVWPWGLFSVLMTLMLFFSGVGNGE